MAGWASLSASKPARPQTSPPTDEIPVTLPLERMIVRSDETALAVTGATAFSVGITLNLLVAFRGESAPTELEADLHRLMRREWTTGMPFVEVHYLGSRRTVSSDRRTDEEARRARQHSILTMLHMRGGGPVWSVTYWLHPLPLDGFTLAVAWANAALPRTEWTVRPGLVRQAHGSVEKLWP